MQKYRRTTFNEMTHADCMLDTQGYRHILRMCNTCSVSAQQWLRERASMLRLYVEYLSCLQMSGSLRDKTGLILVSFSDKSYFAIVIIIIIIITIIIVHHCCCCYCCCCCCHHHRDRHGVQTLASEL